MCEPVHARQLLSTSLQDLHFVSTSSLSGNVAPATNIVGATAPNTLGHIHAFSQCIIDASYDNPGKRLIICAGRDPEMVTRCALLVGGFLIICNRVALADVVDMFSPIIPQFSFFRPTPGTIVAVLDCWRALDRARCLSWLGGLHKWRYRRQPLYRHAGVPPL